MFKDGTTLMESNNFRAITTLNISDYGHSNITQDDIDFINLNGGGGNITAENYAIIKKTFNTEAMSLSSATESFTFELVKHGVKK
jgi:hypothetical protein